MRHQDPWGQRPQQVVVVAIAAAGLVADLEAAGQGLEDPQHLFQAADLATLDELPLLAEHAKRDALRVNVQSDVKHKAPLENRRTSGLKPLLSRYPIDRGFLHSSTPLSVAVTADRLSSSSRKRVPCPRCCGHGSARNASGRRRSGNERENANRLRLLAKPQAVRISFLLVLPL